MLCLDCQTRETTLTSVAAILGIELSELCHRIRRLTQVRLEIRNYYDQDVLLPMLRHAAERDLPDLLPGRTNWFHATRVANPDELRLGLRPVKSQLNHTWEFLFSLVDGELTSQVWRDFRHQFESEDYGQSEMVIKSWLSDGGPCGFLFAEQALNPTVIGDHPYLEISELVDFIAREVERRFRIPLRERHFNSTHPCLVKFTTNGVRKIDLAFALAYLDHLESGGAAGAFRGNTISRKGTPVPSGDIEAVIQVAPYGRRWQFKAATIQSVSARD